MNLIRKNKFVFGLLLAVLLAFVFPQFGAPDGPLKAGLLSKLGVMTIFLLQGLTLRTRDLAGSMRQVKLHAFTQGWIFLFSPVFHIGAALILKALSLGELANGFIYLALIPTTITSAVIFTTATGGNVPASIFNTTFSNVLGVFWVPTGFLLIFATGNGMQADLIGPLLWKVAQLILIPLLIGQVLRPFVDGHAWFLRLAPRFKVLNHGIILFIVFTAFSQSFLSNSWEGIPPLSILLLLALTAATVLLVHASVWVSSRGLSLSRADRIAALYCGSQKTLAAGAPMAIAIFSNGDLTGQMDLGLLLLPLLCYHPLQLLFAAAVLPKLQA